jgi:hypothetical protein
VADVDGNGGLDLLIPQGFDSGISLLRAFISPGPPIPAAKGGLHTSATQDLLPQEFALGYNYPNPFNPVTHIRYQLPEPGPVQLEIYNIAGQRLRLLVNAEQNAGFYQAAWDGRDSLGRPAASGIYFYRLVSRGLVQTRRMLLLK